MDILNQLIANKHRYGSIDQVISDTELINAARSTPNFADPTSPLTLPGCLVVEWPEMLGGLSPAVALDLNIRELLSAKAIKQPSRLAKRLVNRTDFLNTLSELAFARTLLDNSCEIELDKKFFGERDVDVFATRNGQEDYIDVVNLGAEPLASEIVYWGSVREPEERDRVVTKIVEKCGSKFGDAIKSGWPGRAWVALDVAKRGKSNIETTLAALLVPGWGAELGQLVRSARPELAGVFVYRSDARDTHVHVLAKVERPQIG